MHGRRDLSVGRGEAAHQVDDFVDRLVPLTQDVALRADLLLENVRLAYKARTQVPWGRRLPEEVFLNDVLPYANVDETRELWRNDFYERCLPIVKVCKTPGEAAQKLNGKLFKTLNVKY